MGLSNSIPNAILQEGVCTSTTRPANPYVGQTIYETDTGSLLVYYGATTGWRPPWNQPWGHLTTISGPAASALLRSASSSAALTYITGSFTHINNRIVEVAAQCCVSWTTSTNVAWKLTVDSTTVGYQDMPTHVSSGVSIVSKSTSNGSSQTYTVSLLFGGAVSALYQAGAQGAYMTLKDIGPSTSTAPTS